MCVRASNSPMGFLTGITESRFSLLGVRGLEEGVSVEESRGTRTLFFSVVVVVIR